MQRLGLGSPGGPAGLGRAMRWRGKEPALASLCSFYSKASNKQILEVNLQKVVSSAFYSRSLSLATDDSESPRETGCSLSFGRRGKLGKGSQNLQEAAIKFGDG